MSKSKTYEAVAERILEIMGSGSIPWVKPWTTSGGFGSTENLITGHKYRGINTILTSGFDCPFFLTYKQAQDIGANVRKGARGVPVVYWLKVNSKTKLDDDTTTESDGEQKTINRSFLASKYYTVFNAKDLENVPERWLKVINASADAAAIPLKPKHDIAESVIQALKVEVRSSDRASYSPNFDYINMPPRESFDHLAEYYSTFFHELGHWTGHSGRLNRKELTGANYFGSHEYSKEELTAELTAAFVCSELNISTESSTRNSAAYLQSWMKVLKNDPSMIVDATQRAQKAADLILKREVKHA